MNILICDDKQDEAREIGVLLSASDYKVSTNIFSNGYDALDFIHTGAVIDVCFLDIVMPEMSGVTLARHLRKDGWTGDIVFLSTSREYGPESYEVKAFSYLLKPLTPVSVNDVLAKLEHARSTADTIGITVKTSSAARVILYRNISYVEVIRHKVYFRMTDGNEVELYAVFSDVARELLSDPRFVQCHRSYIVNMRDIEKVSEREIVTHGGARIPIARNYRETRNRFYKWMFGENGK